MNRSRMQPTHARESVPTDSNPLGMAGIEFIEYVTSRPQSFGQVLEQLGFHAIARHRSREVVLYRQGGMNLVVNAHPDDTRVAAMSDGMPMLSAVAFRVQDAQSALDTCVDLGAWEVASHARAMELQLPAIHGPGTSRFYFVDRWREFSIYDIDFKPIPDRNQNPPAQVGMDYFGVVQYVDSYRAGEWMVYLERLFGFSAIPEAERFGILPHGTLMRSPCQNFLWQLVAPIRFEQSRQSVECLRRIGIGVPDVTAAVTLLESRGVEFVDSDALHPDDRGALTSPVLGGVAFELVHRSVKPESC